MRKNLSVLFIIVAVLVTVMITNNSNAYVLFNRSPFCHVGDPCIVYDYWIPQVGHLSGVGGSVWRADVWIYAPVGADVQFDFYPRGESSSAMQYQYEYQLQAGEVLQLGDIVGMFGFEGAGAVRFTSSRLIVVTGKAYNANSPTPSGPGTAGQQFTASNPSDALSKGEWSDLVGVGQTDKFRTNFGFVEVAGQPVTIKAQLLDKAGALINERTYDLGANGVVQMSLNDLSQTGIGAITDQRLHFGVVNGDGKAIGFGSLIDNVTGDPITLDMTKPFPRPGRYNAVAVDADGSYGGSVSFTAEFDDNGVLRLTTWIQAIHLECLALGLSADLSMNFKPEEYGFKTALPLDGSSYTAASIDYSVDTLDGRAGFETGSSFSFLPDGGIKGEFWTIHMENRSGGKWTNLPQSCQQGRGYVLSSN